ncbi:hypothetical protein [Streptomyces microflavus]|uniref:hypothetical protein n=1 Tax=Streptomyces microflavus TaxID=1919 RepID=UPI003B2277F0
MSRDEATGAWHIDIRLVLHRGHRALDVTRAVHTATLAAVRTEPSVSVRVTVTGWSERPARAGETAPRRPA